MADDPFDRLSRKLDEQSGAAHERPRHETTLRGAPAPPGPGSQAPKRSVSPSPESSSAVRVQVGDVDVRVRASGLRRFLPWIVPLVLSLAGTIGGAVMGYFRGLAAAGERVAAVEESVRIQGQKRAALEARVVAAEQDLDRAFLVQRDHDKRLPTLERDQARLAERVQALEQQKAIVVRPSN